MPKLTSIMLKNPYDRFLLPMMNRCSRPIRFEPEGLLNLRFAGDGTTRDDRNRNIRLGRPDRTVHSVSGLIRQRHRPNGNIETGNRPRKTRPSKPWWLDSLSRSDDGATRQNLLQFYQVNSKILSLSSD